jgi:hypothetical protein
MGTALVDRPQPTTPNQHPHPTPPRPTPTAPAQAPTTITRRCLNGRGEKSYLMELRNDQVNPKEHQQPGDAKQDVAERDSHGTGTALI